MFKWSCIEVLYLYSKLPMYLQLREHVRFPPCPQKTSAGPIDRSAVYPLCRRSPRATSSLRHVRSLSARPRQVAQRGTLAQRAQSAPVGAGDEPGEANPARTWCAPRPRAHDPGRRRGAFGPGRHEDGTKGGTCSSLCIHMNTVYIPGI